ncbi:nucleotidyltransferase family protein [cf. Phormidesmis sp. LEGE 11477]|uniref:nucleotidyltransferase family protein n=1 Tax=cf. Phormidesmis sp. LEGE 11477 TaxID=1828680 RepID=UPI00187ED6D8|nr:nucleotidyltransferase domain-containing protein [cf. Phormidesmis sp. LEGE 11477]MBE9061203.1 nucleotidyltransferase domain-containing protein [cf. Phormidesmis sp. LEGE 11477]
MEKEVLDQENLQQLLREFKQRRGSALNLRALGYFGSYARQEARPDSDVDIVFETDSPNLFMTARLREELVEVLGRSVDVIRYRERMSPRFKARLEKESIYVCEERANR